MLTVALGFEKINGRRVLLSFWPSDAGMLTGGCFDEAAWIRRTTHLLLPFASDPRTMWKLAYRHVRKMAHKNGGFEWCPDGQEDEPCPFPDRKKSAR